MVQEFLGLNRRRLRDSLRFSPEQQDRWTVLRWRIEEAMGGSAARHGAARRSLRVPADLKVECEDSARSEVATAHEIAEGGVFLVTDQPFAVGTPLRLRLLGDRGETVEVEGAVVWVRQPGSAGGPPGVGIEFSSLDASHREAVAYLVEEALAALDPTCESY